MENAFSCKNEGYVFIRVRWNAVLLKLQSHYRNMTFRVKRKLYGAMHKMINRFSTDLKFSGMGVSGY